MWAANCWSHSVSFWKEMENKVSYWIWIIRNMPIEWHHCLLIFFFWNVIYPCHLVDSCCSNSVQMSSVKPKSGLCADQSSSSTLNPLIHVFMDLALCTGEQSCWNSKRPSPSCSHRVRGIKLARQVYLYNTICTQDNHMQYQYNKKDWNYENHCKHWRKRNN